MYTASWRDVVRRASSARRRTRRDRPYRFIIRVDAGGLPAVPLPLRRPRLRARARPPAARSSAATTSASSTSRSSASARCRSAGWCASWPRRRSSTTGSPARSCAPCSTSRSTARPAPPPSSPPSARSRTARSSASSPRRRSARSFTVKDLKAGAARMADRRRRADHPGRGLGRAPGRHQGPQGRSCAAACRSRSSSASRSSPEPGEKAQPLLRRTKAAMEALLDEAQRSYPDQPPAPTTAGGCPSTSAAPPPPRRRPPLSDALRAAGHAAKAEAARSWPNGPVARRR